MNRILFIRGGAIGDFILTLPAIKALRDARPDAHIEILGYKHIAALAENRLYAEAVRSIEYGPLAGFFAKASTLSPDLADYFAGFDLIVSYLYDPDQIFENNLRRSGVREIVCGPAKVSGSSHAARQLAAPIEKLGIKIDDLSAKLFPSVEDRRFAADFLRDLTEPVLAIHPGSGSEQKNWPVENWIHLGNNWIERARFSSSRNGGVPAAVQAEGRVGDRPSLIVVSGEADEVARKRLEREWSRFPNVRFATCLPLPQLAAVLADSVFVGHDSGISHLAAAAGANCVLLFGPTDPEVWAPKNNAVRVIRPISSKVGDIELGVVQDVLNQLSSVQSLSSIVSSDS